MCRCISAAAAPMFLHKSLQHTTSPLYGGLLRNVLLRWRTQTEASPCSRYYRYRKPGGYSRPNFWNHLEEDISIQGYEMYRLIMSKRACKKLHNGRFDWTTLHLSKNGGTSLYLYIYKGLEMHEASVRIGEYDFSQQSWKDKEKEPSNQN